MLTAPTLAPISESITINSGAPLHIALDGADADGDRLSYEVSTNNPGVTASILSGDRSLRMNVNNFGTMEFYLFEDEAPDVTARIIELTQQGFYNGLKFHRIIPGFVSQGGDPLGNGTGGSGVEFDDQYDPDLRHTSTGILSLAKTLDDTNDSQFFITNGAPRTLDFNHSVFGFLTNGDSVRAAINNVGTPSGTPTTPVTIGSVTVFNDQENGVLRLSAPEGSAGTISVTVTVRDTNGQSAQQTFTVTVLPDQRNDTPFLEEIQALATASNIPLTFTLSARDVEGVLPGGGVKFGAVADETKVNVQFSNTGTVTPDVNGLAQVSVTITPKNGFIGNTPITFFAHDPDLEVPDDPAENPDFQRFADVQTQSLNVTEAGPPPAPTGLDLTDASDTGASPTDNVTAFNNTSDRKLTFRLSGLIPGAQVILRAGETVIADVVASSTSQEIVTTGTAVVSDGSQAITATQSIGGFTSPRSALLAVQIDAATPLITSEPPPSTLAGLPFGYDASSTEEGQPGFTYRVLSSPPGFEIDETTGVVSWTPTHSELGPQFVAIRATDLAGNFFDQEFNVDIINAPPELADIADQVISEELPFLLPLSVNDANLPGDTLQFRLIEGAPAGLSIDNAGVLRWTPTEIQGPGTYVVNVEVTDAGGLSDTKSFLITVIEVNRSPVIEAVPGQFVLPGDDLELQIVASDPDVPTRSLTYSLLQGPDGATIDPVTGVFRFTAPQNQAALSIPVVIQVTENGEDPLSSTVSFNLNTFDAGLGFFVNGNLRATAETPETETERVNDFVSTSLGLSLLNGRSRPLIGGQLTPEVPVERVRGGAPNFLFVGPETGVPQISNEILDGQAPERGELNQPATPETNATQPRPNQSSRLRRTRPAVAVDESLPSGITELSESDLSDVLAERAAEEAAQPDQNASEPVESDPLTSMQELLDAAAEAEAAVKAAKAELESKLAELAQARRRRAGRSLPLGDGAHRLHSPERLPTRGEQV